MFRIPLRQIAAALVMAVSASLAPAMAGEAPAELPPKPYEIPKKGVPDHIRAAVESAARAPEMKARDGYRRPAEILALTGLRKGARVVELGPYDLYYSTILAEAIGPKGELHMYEVPDIDAQTAQYNRAFVEKHPQAKYSGADFRNVEFPRNVDLVFNFLYFHEILLRSSELEAFHTKLFKAMKPGAIYMVIDHAAEHGTGTDHVGPLRRIDPGVIRPYVSSAGFELVEDSRLLENHADDHKWAVDTSVKNELTDKVVYKFRKPIVY